MSELGSVPLPANGLEFPFTEADYQTIVSIVYERSGIVLAAHKRDMTYSRLARRLRALGLRSFRDYCALLSRKESNETGFLINAITTNLTKFFRESHHFEHLEKEVFPALTNFSRGESKPHIRVWSAGCSSGEEPYSIAMTAIAARQQICRDWDLRILATDLDTAMLRKAKAGIYAEALLGDVPARMRSRFFEAPAGEDASAVPVSKAVQNLITFKQLNLLGPWPMSGQFDAIFCRNVMIYFDAKTKNTLIERFHAILKDGGWLYVGHSESLLDHAALFKLRGRTIYQKTKA